MGCLGGGDPLATDILEEELRIAQKISLGRRRLEDTARGPSACFVGIIVPPIIIPLKDC